MNMPEKAEPGQEKNVVRTLRTRRRRTRHPGQTPDADADLLDPYRHARIDRHDEQAVGAEDPRESIRETGRILERTHGDDRVEHPGIRRDAVARMPRSPPVSLWRRHLGGQRRLGKR